MPHLTDTAKSLNSPLQPQQSSPCATLGQALPAKVEADLRTDHAGETGAVCTYHGVLRFTKDPGVRDFAQRQLATERDHLRQIEEWLPRQNRSARLSAWRLAGWLTGALPALLGPRAVYATIEAVERFVNHHCGAQLRRLQAHPTLQPLRQTLLACQGDEVPTAMRLPLPGVRSVWALVCASGVGWSAWARTVLSIFLAPSDLSDLSDLEVT